MNTRLALLIEYETAQIPVERIAKPLLGLSYDEARRRISAGTFPVPVFQLLQSAKAPWLVTVEDLASYIERCAEEARNAKRIPTGFASRKLGSQK